LCSLDVQAAAEIIANLCVFLSSVCDVESEEDGYSDVDEVDDHCIQNHVGTSMGSTSSVCLASNQAVIEWQTLLSDRSTVVQTATMFSCVLEVFAFAIEGAAGGSTTAVTNDMLLDIADSIDRLASCCGNIIPHVRPLLLSFPAHFPVDAIGVGSLNSIAFSPSCTSLSKDLLTLFGRSYERLLSFDEFILGRLKLRETQTVIEEPLSEGVDGEGEESFGSSALAS
jgi:hypothetical protein